MPSVIWTRPALADVERVFSFLKEKNPDAARRAAQTINHAATQLGEMPHIGVRMPDDTGRREYFTPFGKHGYILRYMLDEENPVILRVWHGLDLRDYS